MFCYLMIRLGQRRVTLVSLLAIKKLIIYSYQRIFLSVTGHPVLLIKGLIEFWEMVIKSKLIYLTLKRMTHFGDYTF